MNTVTFWIVAASACPNGDCPQPAVAPVQPVPVVVYQAAPRPLFPWLAPRPQQPQILIVR